MQFKQTGYEIFRHFIGQWKWKMGFLIDLISWLNKHTTHLNKEDGVYPTKTLCCMCMYWKVVIIYCLGFYTKLYWAENGKLLWPFSQYSQETHDSGC